MYYIYSEFSHFFIECERLFNPYLIKKPFVITSPLHNNIIARSEEAAQLGISRAGPFVTLNENNEHKNVIALKANFSLYADMSQRVMDSIKISISSLKIYGIDKFLYELNDDDFQNVRNLCIKIKNQVKKWTNISLSFGIGKTPFLAKLAHISTRKNHEKILSACNIISIEKMLSHTYIIEVDELEYEDIITLHQFGIYSLLELRNASQIFIKDHCSQRINVVYYALNVVNNNETRLISTKKVKSFKKELSFTILSFSNLEKNFVETAEVAFQFLQNNKRYSQFYGIYIESPDFMTKSAIIYLNSLASREEQKKIFLEKGKAFLKSHYNSKKNFSCLGIILIDMIDEKIIEDAIFNQNRHSETISVIPFKIRKIPSKNPLPPLISSSRFTTCWEELVTVY